LRFFARRHRLSSRSPQKKSSLWSQVPVVLSNPRGPTHPVGFSRAALTTMAGEYEVSPEGLSHESNLFRRPFMGHYFSQSQWLPRFCPLGKAVSWCGVLHNTYVAPVEQICDLQSVPIHSFSRSAAQMPHPLVQSCFLWRSLQAAAVQPPSSTRDHPFLDPFSNANQLPFWRASSNVFVFAMRLDRFAVVLALLFLRSIKAPLPGRLNRVPPPMSQVKIRTSVPNLSQRSCKCSRLAS